jgi:hypothetical protein
MKKMMVTKICVLAPICHLSYWKLFPVKPVIVEILPGLIIFTGNPAVAGEGS